MRHSGAISLQCNLSTAKIGRHFNLAFVGCQKQNNSARRTIVIHTRTQPRLSHTHTHLICNWWRACPTTARRASRDEESMSILFLFLRLRISAFHSRRHNGETLLSETPKKSCGRADTAARVSSLLPCLNTFHLFLCADETSA